MADTKISQMPAAATLDGTEIVPLVQTGDNVQATTSDFVSQILDVNPVTVAQGGTNATTAADARTNLGLGTMAVQDADSVDISGGTAQVDQLITLGLSGYLVGHDTSPVTAVATIPIGDIAYEYGAWHSTQSQSSSTTAGTAITVNVTDIPNAITIVDNSKFTVPVTGKYNFQFSMQLQNTDNAQQDATIWFKVNGTDVAASATQITVPARKSANIYGYAVAAWNIFLELNTNDYVQLFWLVESTTITAPAKVASVTPAYPAIPSVIVTMNQVG